MCCVMNDIDDTNRPYDMDNVYTIHHRDVHKLMNMNFVNENHNIDKSWQHGWQKNHMDQIQRHGSNFHIMNGNNYRPKVLVWSI